MRTLAAVILLVWLAVAAGLSFVVDAGASPATGAGATLQFACDRGAVGIDVPTTLTCGGSVTNSGSTPLREAQLIFVTAAGAPPPDRWYFFREVVDGAERRFGGTTTVFSLGDLRPGERRRIELGVVVQSTHDFGAVAQIVAARGMVPLASQGIAIDADPASPPVTAQFGRVAAYDCYDGPACPRAPVVLEIFNQAPRFESVTAELALNDNVTVRPTMADPWAQASNSGRWRIETPPIDTGTTRGITIDLAPAGGGAGCAPVAGVAIVTVNSLPIAAAFTPPDAMAGVCDQTATELPAGGFGPDARPPDAAPAALFALGCALAAAGLHLRRLRA